VAEIRTASSKDRVASNEHLRRLEAGGCEFEMFSGSGGLDSEHEVEARQFKQQGREGFAKKHNIAPASLERRQTPKGEIVGSSSKDARANLICSSEYVDKIRKKTPRFQDHALGRRRRQFVRPVHGLDVDARQHVIQHRSRRARRQYDEWTPIPGRASIRLSTPTSTRQGCSRRTCHRRFAVRKSEIDSNCSSRPSVMRRASASIRPSGTSHRAGRVPGNLRRHLPTPLFSRSRTSA